MSVSNGGKGGIIVNVASVAALTNMPTLPIYGASKYGVLGFTRSMAVSLFYLSDRTARISCLFYCSTTSIIRSTALNSSSYVQHLRTLRSHLYRMRIFCILRAWTTEKSSDPLPGFKRMYRNIWRRRNQSTEIHILIAELMTVVEILH